MENHFLMYRTIGGDILQSLLIEINSIIHNNFMIHLTHQESYIALFLLSLEKRKIPTWCLKRDTAKKPSGGSASDFGWARSCRCAIKLVKLYLQCKSWSKHYGIMKKLFNFLIDDSAVRGNIMILKYDQVLCIYSRWQDSISFHTWENQLNFNRGSQHLFLFFPLNIFASKHKFSINKIKLCSSSYVRKFLHIVLMLIVRSFGDNVSGGL